MMLASSPSPSRHNVVHGVRRIDGEETAGKAASLAPVALEQHGAVPVARQMQSGCQAVPAGVPGRPALTHFEAQHGRESDSTICATSLGDITGVDSGSIRQA